LAAAHADRTQPEFHSTCTSWLLHHLLPGVPTGELLTYLDHRVHIFGPVQVIHDEIGSASVAITPHRYPPSLTHLERYGKFSTSWVSLRHDATGLACAADWARQCGEWCFTRVESDRYIERKYLDAWTVKYPGTVALAHPGVNLAPWNIPDGEPRLTGSGLCCNGRPVIFYDFRHLTDLGRQLYDPGLHEFDLVPTDALRELVYRPYLRQLARHASVQQEEPDLVPSTRTDDPRCAAAISRLLLQLRTAERDRAACLLALEKNRAAALQANADHRIEAAQTARYIQEIERDRDAQRKSLLATEQKLKTAYSDLERNVVYLRRLQDEIAAHVEVSIVRDAHIASLNEKLTRLSVASEPLDNDEIRAVLGPYVRHLRKLLVAKYHPSLLTQLPLLAEAGIPVEVLGSPSELAGKTEGSVQFRAETLWEWLGRINSLFNEKIYLLANPDVADAVGKGAVISGWDHYLRFGQQEGRKVGAADYCSGLAEIDAIAFDSSDREQILPCLMGRLQPHVKLIVTSYFSSATGWLPPDTSGTTILNDLLFCQRPPKGWLGPRQPINAIALNGPQLQPQDIYPALPAQRAEWPRITVVTATFNQAEFLEETIGSVLKQNYPNLEYIIVDGGSTDGSLEIIRKYAAQLAWWVSEKDHGPAEALNQGLRHATGQILSRLDSGDSLAPGSLYTVGQTFLLHDTDLVAGRCARVLERQPQPRNLHRSSLPLDRIVPLPLNELLDIDQYWLREGFFLRPGIFFRRDVFDRAGAQMREDLRHCLDYDLWVRLARAGARVFALPEVLAIFRENDRQVSDGDTASTLAELRAVNADHRRAVLPSLSHPA